MTGGRGADGARVVVLLIGIFISIGDTRSADLAIGVAELGSLLEWGVSVRLVLHGETDSPRWGVIQPNPQECMIYGRFET